MSNKKQVFGLSLLDVLSNALVAAIVLMMIAATFVRVLDGLSDVEDTEAGDADHPSAVEFKHVNDPKRAKLQLNINLELIGGNPKKVTLSARYKDGGKIEKYVSVYQGIYDKKYWLVTRDSATFEKEWSIVITGDEVSLPNSIEIHANSGLTPLSIQEDVRIYKKIKAGILIDILDKDYPEITRPL